MVLGLGLKIGVRDSVGDGAEFGYGHGFGITVRGVAGLGERTRIRLGLVNLAPQPAALFLPSGFFSYLNYMNFWSLLAIQAIWT